MPSDDECPYLGIARRLVSAKKSRLFQVLRDTKSIEDEQWNSWIGYIKKLVSWCDEDSLLEEYDGEPWYTFRTIYRKQVGIRTESGTTNMVAKIPSFS